MKCKLLILLLLSSVGWSQTHQHVASPSVVTQMQASMNHADQWAWVDNKPNCLVAGAHNCTHDLPAATSLQWVSAGSDDYTLIIDNSRNVQQYNDYPDNTLTLQSQFGNQMAQLLVLDAGHIYGLAAMGTQLNSVCTANQAIYKWSGTAWVWQSGCGTSLAASGDGTIWTTVPTAGGTQGVWKDVAGVWSRFIAGGIYTGCSIKANGWGYCVKSDGTYWYQQSGGAWTQGTAPFGNTVKALVEDLANNVWFLTSGVNNLWRWDQTAQTFTQFYGTHTLPTAPVITTGGDMLTFMISLNVGGFPHLGRFADYTIQFSTDIHGTTTCSPPPCPHSTHQPHITFQWNNNVGSLNQSGPTMYADQFDQSNRYAIATWDPFLFFEGNNPLSINVLGIDCAIAGANFVKFIFTKDGGSQSVQFPGKTNFKVTAGDCTTGSNCAITNYCSTASTPPNYDETNIRWWGWDNSGGYVKKKAFCVSVSGACPDGILCQCRSFGFAQRSQPGPDPHDPTFRFDCSKGTSEGNIPGLGNDQ